MNGEVLFLAVALAASHEKKVREFTAQELGELAWFIEDNAESQTEGISAVVNSVVTVECRRRFLPARVKVEAVDKSQGVDAGFSGISRSEREGGGE